MTAQGVAKQTYDQERTPPGRRQRDIDCAAHEERMDAAERKLAWQKGAMYVAIGCLAAGFSVFGWMGNAIYVKVTTIEQLLNRSEIAAGILAEQFKGIDRRVQAIEDRHIYEQQKPGR